MRGRDHLQSCDMGFMLQLLEQSPHAPDYHRVLELALQPGVTDLIANGPADWWVDRGSGLEQLPQFALGDESMDWLARTLVALGGRHLDAVNPIADAALGAGQVPALKASGVARLRVHATLRSAVSDNTLLSIRVHRSQLLSLADYRATGFLDDSQLGLLQWIAQARKNFLVSGPAGSGKTSLLRAMLAQTPGLRTVAVEDVAELTPAAGHVLSLQTRQANSEGAGLISLERLAVEALRMRPDRFVVGEVRGGEARILLQAMNTGHLGSAATIHANAANSVAARLRWMLNQSHFTEDSFRGAALTAIEYVIHLKTGPDRGVESIGRFDC